MLLASASVVGAVIYMLSISCVHQRQETARIRARLTVLTIWMMGIVVWPVLWAGIFKEERFDLMSKLSLLWPILIIGTDITAMHQMTYEAAHTHSKRQMLSIDSNAICSLTFALSGLIGAHRHPCCNKIFLLAVLGCIVFILPAPYANTIGREAMMIETFQKIILSYATGLLIGGIMLVMNGKGTIGLHLA